MDNHINAFKCAVQTFFIADIADEVAQGRVFVAGHTHLMLFELIAAVDNDLGRMILFEHHLNKFFTE
ncbi:hypothetical protein SDC9_174085 [bioreactor metagenome]|uniref:Uncharacterized protein n=1 Tax=bioreactor metagenome TaxID=1076179 RepID=A0A645GKI9_9ZZZZ